jgi:alpha-D-xyloside xylohydrolase
LTVTTSQTSIQFSLESNQGAVVLAAGDSRLRIEFRSPSIARVTLTHGKPFLDRTSLIIISTTRFSKYKLLDHGESFVISTSKIQLVVSKSTGAIRYLDHDGKLLLAEPSHGGKSLYPNCVTRNQFHKDAAIADGLSIDGARATAEKYETVFDRNAFEAKLEFTFADDEALFGLGSHEEGYGNLRGKSRDLYQQNMKMVVPHLVSSKGYSVLWDCGSLMTFRDTENGALWWADTVDELDYYFICGGNFDGVTRLYHELTGKAPMLPKWAFGFIQSKERYVNSAELIEVVREYRRRKIPLDAIVLDWKSWPNGAGWGQKSFDPTRFPDPTAMTRELHELNTRLMVSIWPIMTNACPNQLEMLRHGKMLGNQSTYDAFDPAARKVYWEQVNRGLFTHGVDAWWCDCTEPFEADWTGTEKLSAEERMRINVGEAAKYLDRASINTYSLPHSCGIFEGQRSENSDKRVVNLTRSSYAGQHRYGTVCWNGDICGTWETLRKCIPEGVNFCATGEPYWTVDIGGFFINHDPEYWFWRGEYSDGTRGLTGMDLLQPDASDAGCRDLGFHELYTRWTQYAVFLPMFRSHGTDAAREIWRFGEPGSPFYDAIAAAICLRYQLLPYLYTLASEVSRDGRMMMRAVALDFPQDLATHQLDDQFLCGPSLLVCPVCQAMLYGPSSLPLHEVPQSREVYLPMGADWYSFQTGEFHAGGQRIDAAAPLESIPVFVRAGSILPIGPVVQSSSEISREPIELHIYPGADADFALYDDAGDGWAYESGEFCLTPIHWNQQNQELTIGERQGGFLGMPPSIQFRVILIGKSRAESLVVYQGQEKRILKDQFNPPNIVPIQPVHNLSPEMHELSL